MAVPLIELISEPTILRAEAKNDFKLVPSWRAVFGSTTVEMSAFPE